MSDAHNQQQAQGFFAALARADKQALLAVFASNISWVVPKTAVPPYAGTHHGAEHIADMMLGSMQHTFVEGSLNYAILLWLSGPERVMAEVNLTGTTRDGRTYDNFYVFIFEMEGGLITQIREHVDTAYATRFFGAKTSN